MTSQKHYRYRCIDPNDVRELSPAKIEYDVRFEDEDHVWIDGKQQYISLRRFQEAVTSAKTGRKTGRWEINEHTYAGLNRKNWKCTNCCTGMYDFILTSVCKPGWKFCPNCGADMREVKVKCGDEDTLQGGLMSAT